MSEATFYTLSADIVLVVHFAIVAFVIFGLVAVWLGFFLRWHWVRNIYFRATHLVIMAIVTTQALLDVACPLTTWENKLRFASDGGNTYEGSFLEHWIHKVLFPDFSSGAFTVAYCVFFFLVALSFVVVRPGTRAQDDTNSHE